MVLGPRLLPTTPHPLRGDLNFCPDVPTNLHAVSHSGQLVEKWYKVQCLLSALSSQACSTDPPALHSRASFLISVSPFPRKLLPLMGQWCKHASPTQSQVQGLKPWPYQVPLICARDAGQVLQGRLIPSLQRALSTARHFRNVPG